jgi:hypothetical protein
MVQADTGIEMKERKYNNDSNPSFLNFLFAHYYIMVLIFRA